MHHSTGYLLSYTHILQCDIKVNSVLSKQDMEVEQQKFVFSTESKDEFGTASPYRSIRFRKD